MVVNIFTKLFPSQVSDNRATRGIKSSLCLFKLPLTTLPHNSVGDSHQGVQSGSKLDEKSDESFCCSLGILYQLLSVLPMASSFKRKEAADGALCTSASFFYFSFCSRPSSWQLHWENCNPCLGGSVSSVLIAFRGTCSAPMGPLQRRRLGATGWVLGTRRVAQAD